MGVPLRKYFNYFLILLTQIILLSCATRVEIRTVHPPLVDMRRMETITVIPLEWRDSGAFNLYAKLYARDLTRILITNVRTSRILQFVDPAILRNIERTMWWQFVDVYIESEIINVSITREVEEVKRGERLREYTTVTATVNIIYRYVSAIDGKIIASFNRTHQASQKFDNSRRMTAIRVAALLMTGQTSSRRLVIRALQNISSDIYNEINSLTTTERRRILQSSSGEPRFREAERLVRQRRYNDALILYRRLSEETGSIVAFYNMALILQATGQFTEALALLEDVDERIAERGMETPVLIIEEIERLNSIIYRLIILEDYENI